MEIRITNELNEDQKRQAAEICYDAFSKKIASVWLCDSNPERAIPCLQRCLNYDGGLYALQDDLVLGIMGVDINHNPYVRCNVRNLIETYGLWGAIRRSVFNYIIFSVCASFKHEAMHIDLIATSKEARGKGVGTKLLTSAFDLAREHNIQRISLTVVDTNPRAQKLYERMGFVITDTKDMVITQQRWALAKRAEWLRKSHK